jgi:hypothetical protein
VSPHSPGAQLPAKFYRRFEPHRFPQLPLLFVPLYFYLAGPAAVLDLDSHNASDPMGDASGMGAKKSLAHSSNLSNLSKQDSVFIG